MIKIENCNASQCSSTKLQRLIILENHSLIKWIITEKNSIQLLEKERL